MTLRTYGIRHHGPGSARRLRDALDAWEPQLILLEAPADAQPTLGQLTNDGMYPPLALVLYAAGDIERASFYPFAEFSPEYQAIAWARERGVEVRAIDLPARHYLAKPGNQGELFETEPADPKLERLRRDPLSLIAELAGYPDSERWWDATLEREGRDPEAVFSALLEIVGELRDAYPQASDAENERREAYMRQEIRKALKEEYRRAAIVVGAWHGPAVAEPGTYPTAAADKVRLKGMPKTKIARAWVPWSFPRLARASGYGAGVVSPAWYSLLFDHPDTATERYLSAAARLLRKEGFEGSPALATDGVALARGLASLRGHEQPGIQELEQAILGTLAAGKPERLALIHERLTVGREVGVVPPEVTTVPLLEDLRREIKSTRMSKYWEQAGEHYLKATKADPRGHIDLRQENDLRKSHLLHRLNLLGIPWGRPQPVGEDTVSSFKEIWLLEWQPEFSFTIIERSHYGNTVAVAATARIRERAAELTGVLPLAELTLAALRAALPDAVPSLLRQLRKRAAATEDVLALLLALPALVDAARYGDSRKTDTSSLQSVIEEIAPRIVAGLPAYATQLDDERAEELVSALNAADYAVGQLGQEALSRLWLDGIERSAEAEGRVHPAVEGFCVRLLFDRGRLDARETSVRFSRGLSSGRGALPVANWIGGFLYGGGRLLLHHRELFTLVDDWVGTLEWDDFETVVPLLRRSFADFSAYEKRKIFASLSVGQDAPGGDQKPETGEEHERLLTRLLGWMGEEVTD